MARELAISIYLFFFRVIFNSFKLFPQKEKTVSVASFGDNIHYATQSLRSRSNQRIIYLKDNSCTYSFDESIGTIISFTISNPVAFIRSIYHLATATTILADNYFGFFAVTRFKPDTLTIQLWHAAGSFKQFGLTDPSNGNRTSKAHERFKQVYNAFDHVIIGSEKMGSIFRDSFGITNERLRRTGIPRTDLFYDHQVMYQKKQDMYENLPGAQDKKVILYAPTFRRNDSQRAALDVEKLYEAFGDEYVLLMKQHPSVQQSVPFSYDGFVYTISNDYEINHLLLITDILITDYSSIPFEYALLDKPMLFFAYDIDNYKKSQGVSRVFDEPLPGPIVHTTDEIITTIQQEAFHVKQISSFAEAWNTYSKGNASQQVASLIIEREQPALAEQVN